MSLVVQVYFDYVCPFCFLGEIPFEAALEGKDIQVEWRPFELRPSPSEPLDPIHDPPKLRAWQQFIEPASQKLGVFMKLPQISPHPYTGLAFEGFHFAAERGKGKEYNDRVFKAFFQEEKNIGDLEVLTALAVEVGLEEGAFRTALQQGTYRKVQEKALHHAYAEARIDSVPTFIIGGKRLSGLHSKETFDKYIEEAMQEQGKE